MTKTRITEYLHTHNKTLTVLFTKLSQLTQWNNALTACLENFGPIKKHCQVINRSGDALLVVTDSPDWLTRLRFLIPDLLPALKQHPGLESIKAICCKVNPAQEKNNFKSNPKKRPPISPSIANAFYEDANQIADEKLRQIMINIAYHLKKSNFSP